MVPQSLLLWAWLLFCYERRIKVNDLNKQAIILIYADGQIEKIPIADYYNHIEYLKDHLKESERFANIFDGYDLIIVNNFCAEEFYNILARNGIIVLHNTDVYDIVKNKMTITFPEFWTFMPSNPYFNSLEQ